MNETQLVSTDRRLTHLDDEYCFSQGIGFTCIVSKTTRGAADLTKYTPRAFLLSLLSALCC